MKNKNEGIDQQKFEKISLSIRKFEIEQINGYALFKKITRKQFNGDMEHHLTEGLTKT